MKRLLALLIAISLQGAVFADTDASHYLLTEATLHKLKAVQADIDRAGIDTSNDLSGSDSVDVMASKIDANGVVKGLLAKQGLTPLDCALTVNAMLYAGSVILAEQNGETGKAQSLLAAATQEQRANVALLRSSAKAAR